MYTTCPFTDDSENTTRIPSPPNSPLIFPPASLLSASPPHIAPPPLDDDTESDNPDDGTANIPSPTAVRGRHKTFKLVGDNIDKNSTPTEIRVDSQTKPFHYFNSYAVRDRIDLSAYNDCPSLPDPDLIQLDTLLPSNDDHLALIVNFCHLIARVLMSYTPFFSKLGDGLERHIKHEYYSEMSPKSEVVSIMVDGSEHCTLTVIIYYSGSFRGVLLKSEMNYHDMLDIMQSLHKYVPCGIVQGDYDDETATSPVLQACTTFFLVVTKLLSLESVDVMGLERIPPHLKGPYRDYNQ